MIHELDNHTLQIEYRDAVPKEDSWIAIYMDNRLWVVPREEDFAFPSYRETAADLEGTQYLLTLDGHALFWGSLKAEKIAMYKQKLQGVERRFFRNHGTKEMRLLAITAMHLLGWYVRNQYCGACGAALVHDNVERMLRCPACGNAIYPRINPAVIVAIIDTKRDRILFTKYNGREYTKYALVAGFVEIGESFEQTVAREVMEEVGLQVKNIRYYGSQPWGISDNILAGYVCELDGEDTICMDEQELSVAEWIPRTEVQVEMEDMSLTNDMMVAFKEGRI